MRKATKRHLCLLGVAIGCAASIQVAICADGFEMTRISLPNTATSVSNKPDVVGIALGMASEDAKSRIKEIFGDHVSVLTTVLGASYRSVQVQTPSYPLKISDGNLADRIVVNLSPPNGGNVVVGIDRQIAYSNAQTAPLFETVIASLAKKYGQPTCLQKIYNFGALSWMIGASGALRKTSQFGHCPTANWEAGPRDAQLVEEQLADGVSTGVSAVVRRSSADPERAESLEVSVAAYGLDDLFLKDATKQLIDHARDVYQKSAVPDAGPKL